MQVTYVRKKQKVQFLFMTYLWLSLGKTLNQWCYKFDIPLRKKKLCLRKKIVFLIKTFLHVHPSETGGVTFCFSRCFRTNIRKKFVVECSLSPGYSPWAYSPTNNFPKRSPCDNGRIKRIPHEFQSQNTCFTCPGFLWDSWNCEFTNFVWVDLFVWDVNVSPSLFPREAAN